MSTYVTLYRYTDEGLKHIGNAPEIAQGWQDVAQKHGVAVKALYWLQGPWDAVTIIESDDDEAVNALLLAIAQQGYLRSQTMRGLSIDQVQGALKRG